MTELNIKQELARLQKMPPRELRKEYAELHGHASRSGNKQWLIKRILWKMQANIHGTISERACRKALEIAETADIRIIPPKDFLEQVENEQVPVQPETQREQPRDERLPMPGTVLTRQYKGELLQVTVLNDGFEFEGQHYRSLSGIAKAATGSVWNGNLFFRVGKYARNGT